MENKSCDLRLQGFIDAVYVSLYAIRISIIALGTNPKRWQLFPELTGFSTQSKSEKGLDLD